MVDKSQIEKWLREGVITKEQAEKMSSDSDLKDKEDKFNKAIREVSLIGIILIFIGIAWLIAMNWHQIPDFIKVLILVSSTLVTFALGVTLREKNNEYLGRSLILLGAFLFLLSIFLISQIYHLATSWSHYAFLLLFAWVVILITAYLLDSKENLVFSMILFFCWALVQYFSSMAGIFSSSFSPSSFILGIVLIFLSAGAMLFGISKFHLAIEHKFYKVYIYWTVFYFLLLFYVLSFQSILPILGEYSLEGLNLFLIIFVFSCFALFLVGSITSISKKPELLKETLGFIGILAFMFLLILITKIGSGVMGACNPVHCDDLKSPSECSGFYDDLKCEWINDRCAQMSCYNYNNKYLCNNAKSPLVCNWTEYSEGKGSCYPISCINLVSESECNSFNNCVWSNNSKIVGQNVYQGYCTEKETTFKTTENYYMCMELNDKKGLCASNRLCKWNPEDKILYRKRGLPIFFWILWIINNFAFIGFILLMVWYGQVTGSHKIVDLAFMFFVLEIITRYIGFWADFSGYLSFSILAILGGVLLLLGAWQIPKWRKRIMKSMEQ